jgi:hypothetical protein
MVRVTLRLPGDVHKQLLAHVRASGSSLNQTIGDLLSDALGWSGVRAILDAAVLLLRGSTGIRLRTLGGAHDAESR